MICNFLFDVSVKDNRGEKVCSIEKLWLQRARASVVVHFVPSFLVDIDVDEDDDANEERDSSIKRNLNSYIQLFAENFYDESSGKNDSRCIRLPWTPRNIHKNDDKKICMIHGEIFRKNFFTKNLKKYFSRPTHL